jgi:hypothetical protein
MVGYRLGKEAPSLKAIEMVFKEESWSCTDAR